MNNYSTAAPKTEDVFRNVLIKNGVGSADFRNECSSFKTTGNVITAAFQGLNKRITSSLHVQLNVADSNIPIDPTTKLTAFKLTTFPYLISKWVNGEGKAISGQKITFKFNGKEL